MGGSSGLRANKLGETPENHSLLCGGRRASKSLHRVQESRRVQGSSPYVHILKKMSGTPTVNTITDSSMYDVIRKELLAASALGKLSMQAPRMFTSMVLTDDTSSAWFRIFRWWILFSCERWWFTKGDRDFLGGWPAQVSDQYARIARFRLRNQECASGQSPDGDPLQEETAGSTHDLQSFHFGKPQVVVAPRTEDSSGCGTR